MSEFENNGYPTAETVETVENVQPIDNSQTYEQNAYYGAPDDNEGGSKPLAIASLVCGIISLLCSCCGWIGIVISVAAVVLGIVSINKKENAKGMAIAGIVCGGIGLLIGIIVLIMGAAVSSMDPDAITNYVEQLEESL